MPAAFKYLAIFILLALQAAVAAGPVARFTFNHLSQKDNVQGYPIKLVGASYTYDRFGNNNSAIYTFGHQYSYVNLGSNKVLKPSVGSLSLWVKLEYGVWSGTGFKSDPLLIAKRDSADDFYEAYGIYYMLETKKIAVCFVKDSTRQINITSMEEFKMHEWHHLAITYDNDSAAFYIDGVLERKIFKGFETRILAAKPLLLGVTDNKKNNRFSQGAFDDIEIYDHVLNAAQVKALYDAPNPNKNAIMLKRLFTGALIVLGLWVLYIVLRYYIRHTLKKEKQQLELVNKQLETELRVNRALMNPHFIFNSLNTLQNFILKNDNTNAHLYLTKFSKLMRKTLEGNMSDLIGLDLEIELLDRYMEIENLRFEENILYSITVDPAITPSFISIPIMLIQPFVENAIWHGLLKKQGDKKISISFALYEDRYIQCTVEDNGVGRQHKPQQGAENRSLATAFVMQRINLLNKIHHLNCSLSIDDKPGQQGTIVKIILPAFKKQP